MKSSKFSRSNLAINKKNYDTLLAFINSYRLIVSVCLLLSMALFLFGCTSKVIVEEELPSSNLFISSYTKLVILPHSPSDSRFAECLIEGLRNKFKYFDLIDEGKLRDVTFPWLEPEIRPTNANDLLSLIKQPKIKDQIDQLEVQLLIQVEGKTNRDTKGPGILGGYSYGGGAFMGYVELGKQTFISVTVIDLIRMIFWGDAQISSQGTLAVPAFIFPIPINLGYATESSVCEETAQYLANRLTRRSFHK